MGFLDIILSIFEKASEKTATGLSNSYRNLEHDSSLSDAQRQQAREMSLAYKDKAAEIRENREERKHQ